MVHRVNVNDLPPDILLVILRELLLDIRPPNSLVKLGLTPLGWNDGNLEPWPAYDTTMPERTFTENFGTVCRHWREVMSSASLFWTRLVIWVGERPTPLSQISEYLACSRDRPIDIYILEKPRVSDAVPAISGAAQVKAQADAAIKVLASQMKRWRILYAKLVYSSSIPRPRFELVGHADKLTKLQLEFSVDDSDLSEQMAVAGEFDSPEMDKLVISGVHFRESYVRPFPHFPMPPDLDDLSISGYDSRHPPFPMFDLLSCLVTCKKLQFLSLTDLPLDCSYAGPSIYELDPTRSRSDWYVDVHFTDIHGDVMGEYYRLLDYPYVERSSYTRCSFSEFCHVGSSYYLDMEGIADPTSVIVLLCGNAAMREASIARCDGFCSEVLALMSEQGNMRFCWHLKNLYIRE